jgi:hypothetical protein
MLGAITALIGATLACKPNTVVGEVAKNPPFAREPVETLSSRLADALATRICH